MKLTILSYIYIYINISQNITIMELEKRVSGSVDEEMEKQICPNKMKRGGLRTMPFILGSEICDRFAGVGFYANMITYLTQQLNMPLVQASNTLTNFGGTSSFTPLIGALIADSFAGQFWTIAFGSIFYELGFIAMTMSAIIPKLHPKPCPTQVNCQEASTHQLWVLYLALLLTSIGTGGIRPCVVTFAANQFDMTKSGVASRKWNYFNLYYFCMGLATLTALTVIVYIQDNVGWGWGLGIPTISMGLSIIAFVVGYPLYYRPKPGGSPLVRMCQVVVAAWKKRNVPMPNHADLLYHNKQLDALISVDGRLLHTEQFKWLDRAAIATEGETKESIPRNLWNISTVHRVEELKSIIRVLPIWSAGILLVTASSHQSSFVLQQARSMDRHLSHSFQIPPASLSIFSIITMLTGLALYERVLVPFVRKFTHNPAGLTCLQRMGIGYVINIVATLIASFTEQKRKSVASKYGLLDQPSATIPISVFWLVPQYCVHGLAEVFMNVGHLEFLYDQAPESMRSTAAALYCLTTSLGNYLGTMVVSLVHAYTGKQGNWLPDRNINRGHLEYYYLLVTGIQVLNFIYYVVCAMLYRYKPLEQEEELYTQDHESYTESYKKEDRV
ncbi:protein NRT1/ PTR FAMILY 3.1-like [Silene latifolia]|uniref:protein NRT1/ PTR FAMILY 3.1-like n=1 Tax=Silene latifolia TaxID=37657 RepID=UPI003D77733F